MDLLQYVFFQHALIGSILASVLCGIIGTYIVVRRMVFISGGIAHASLGGVGLGAALGFPPLLGASVFSILFAIGMQTLNGRKEVREDSAIAMLWTFGMSIGILCAYLAPDFMPDLPSYLFGNILTITTEGLLVLSVLTLVAAGMFYVFYMPIVSIAFDREFARSQGVPVVKLEYMLLVMIALTIVACLSLVGIILVVSLLSIPQMTANLFTQRFRTMLFLSCGFALLDCVGGLWCSFWLDLPSGATIILVSILVYVCAKTIKRQ